MMRLYGTLPEFLRRAAQTPAMQRLRGVGMNCGCEYTGFARFAACAPYTRFAHSLGVGQITWRFTGEEKQALAALLHDIATPAFSHVVDFLRGDPLRQEATEEGTARIIAADGQLCALLRQLGLTVADVEDYHRYPIADNDAPRLSADRLEYTLGNLTRFGFADEAQVRAMYENITVGQNEDGAPELCFTDPAAALDFARGALRCSEVYVSPEDRYSMQMLAELLGQALERGTLTWALLYRTEAEVIAALRADPVCAAQWERFRAYRTITQADAPTGAGQWRVVPAKRRRIDPLILGQGRVSRVFPDFGEALEKFLRAPQDGYLCANVENGGRFFP